MPATLSPQEFVAKWRPVTLKESASAKEHFIDLCRLVGHPTPTEADPDGKWFTFEAGASKLAGGQGWADVWKKDYFAWEYKGKHASLAKAYEQLLQYREALRNPPLLVVTDAVPSMLEERTLTNLYNLWPEWLELAHCRLDQAVLDAYGWPHDSSDEKILARLLALNQERAAGEA